MEEEGEVVRNLVLSVCDLVQHGAQPVARAGAAVATHNNRLFLFGGADEKRTYNDMYVLEFEQMLWVELTPSGNPPCPRWGHSVSGYEEKLVIFGGFTGEPSDAQPIALTEHVKFSHSGSGLNDVFFAEVATNQWVSPQTTGTPPSPRGFHSSSVAGSNLVIIGGTATLQVDGLGVFAEPLGTVHVLDLRSLAWSSPVVSGTPRAAHRACVQGGNVYVFGGCNDAEVEQLDVATWSWKPVRTSGTPPAVRRYHSFDLVGNRIFCFAGQSATAIEDLYVLDTTAWRWQRPLYEGQLSIRGHSSAVLGDKLLIFGGIRSNKKKEEMRLSKKLFFLNVLEIREGSTDATMKFKLVTVGDSGVGKSCLLTRFVQDIYTDTHVSTIGVDFKTVISMVKGKLVKLQLWDTAGQERFSVVTGNYYRNADGFIFVYDATNKQSFEHIEQWQSQVLQHHDCGPSTIKILVGNKYDLKDQVVVSEHEAEEKAAKLGASFYAVSAKNALNVDMAFLSTAQALVDMRRQNNAQQPKSVQLQRPVAGATPQAGGACGSCPISN
jgi:Ras-related protein Rab-1A